jgi:F-type H+-transporting ATPase subunit epsilon
MSTVDTTKMHLTIITPDKQLFEGRVRHVTLPGGAGSLQVLKDHAPLVSTLQEGTILYGGEGQEFSLPIQGGLVEVSNNSITILVAVATPYEHSAGGSAILARAL